MNVNYDKATKTLTIQVKCDKGIKEITTKTGKQYVLVGELGNRFGAYVIPQEPRLRMTCSVLWDKNPSATIVKQQQAEIALV